MALVGELVPVAQVAAAERDAMFVLMDRHYENVKRDRFETDLEEKDWVIVLRDRASGVLGGFSTQMLLEVEADGRRIRALFSGDTIVDRDRWGDGALSHIWGRLALGLIDRLDDRPLYWFLISKGYRTYRFLPVFFREYYPRLGVTTPSWASEVIDALARKKYANAYDAQRGLVFACSGKDRLRPGIADVTAERLLDPHVRFFVERNPGHAEGSELCCIAPLTRSNFTAAAKRVLGVRESCGALA